MLSPYIRSVLLLPSKSKFVQFGPIFHPISHPPTNFLQNLPITTKAEELYNQTAKQNKKVATTKLPWGLFLVISGENVDAAESILPEADVTPETWKALVWDPVVEILVSKYAKSPALVVVEVFYINSEGNEVSAPTFFKWCPDSGVPVKAKMMIGSCFQSVKRKLDVQGTTPEIGSAAELDLNKFAAAAKLRSWVNVE